MRRLIALLSVLVLALAACSDGSDDGATGIGSLTVTGAFGKAPTIDPGEDFSVDETRSKVMSKGDGSVVKKGDGITFDFAGVNARTGKEFASSFSQGGQPLSSALDEQALPAGLVTGLEGKSVGSRVVVAIPSKDGFPEGNPQVGLEKDDTMIWVVDLVDKIEPKKATGTIDDVEVAGAEGKAPTVTVKKDFYVEATASKVLRKGDGQKVAAGAKIQVQYVGVNGRDGKTFDSSYQRGQPADFTLAEGQLIPGFITGLVGKNVGDRVLITIPADDGYGSTGSPQAGIQPTDTLIFVVDIVKLG